MKVRNLRKNRQSLQSTLNFCINASNLDQNENNGYFHHTRVIISNKSQPFSIKNKNVCTRYHRQDNTIEFFQSNKKHIILSYLRKVILEESI